MKPTNLTICCIAFSMPILLSALANDPSDPTSSITPQTCIAKSQPLSTQPPPTSSPASLAKYILSAPASPQRTIFAQYLWPMQPGRAMFEVLAGQSNSLLKPITLIPIGPSDSPSLWRNNRVEQQVEHLIAGPDGELRLSQLESVRNDLLIRFHPPIKIFPSKLTPDKVFKMLTKITVYDRLNPGKIKSRGKCRFSVVYDADQWLSVPAGRYNCRRLRLTCDAKFNLGKLKSVANLFYADTVGLVAEHYSEIGRMLLFSRRFERTLVLKKPPQPIAPAILATHIKAE